MTAEATRQRWLNQEVRTPMSNPVVHAEITGTEPARLRRFYGALFGWDAEPGDPVVAAVSAQDAYAFNAPGDSSGAVPVGIGGGVTFLPRAVFYVGVDDVEAHLAKAIELGASVVVDVATRPDGGARVAQFADPEGNVVGLAGPV
ncbi:VOC family protein [Pseudokineococcus sp. 5B2Z-1]|uniref:VOC family protein n=1 Tax=Pseudokineococcus sp. 5B2Z-1 TaxID=3132744 RepID=UPI0030A36607